jgi:hypothetical protein
MNASVADILRGAGFVPVCPGYPGQVRDKETQAGSRVPAVPAVPAQKCKGENETAKPASLNAAKVRARLLVLAEAEGIDTELVRALPESELTTTGEQCAAVESESPGRGRELALQYLRLLATDAAMRAGRLPPDFDTPAMCRHCGPVWLPRSQVAMLDVVNGWPRALGCPWCFIHPQGIRIPRPSVTCATCRHYQPDSVNPGEGMGRCGAGVPGMTWPHQSRVCATFKPKEATR